MEVIEPSTTLFSLLRGFLPTPSPTSLPRQPLLLLGSQLKHHFSKEACADPFQKLGHPITHLQGSLDGLAPITCVIN